MPLVVILGPLAFASQNYVAKRLKDFYTEHILYILFMLSLDCYFFKFGEDVNQNSLSMNMNNNYII